MTASQLSHNVKSSRLGNVMLPKVNVRVGSFEEIYIDVLPLLTESILEEYHQHTFRKKMRV